MFLPASSEPHEATRFVDRPSGELRDELVLGEAYLRFAYESRLGRTIRRAILTRAWLSRAYGWYQSSRWSRPSIPRVVRDLAIDMGEYVVPQEGFAHFNEFFARRLRPGARPVDCDPTRFVSPADGRLFAYTNVTGETLIPAKGHTISLRSLLADDAEARRYGDGTVLVVRLCPSDYHRFHFPCDAEAYAPRALAGPLEGVSPMALASGLAILDRNRRDLTFLDTHRFGRVAYIEVGAMCVGSIVHTFQTGQVCAGDEKGFFQFGGSTVIVVFERGRIAVDADLVANTQRGVETFVRMGEALGGTTAGSET